MSGAEAGKAGVAGSAGSDWQGRRLEGLSPEELRAALDAALDYRGDVTLALRDGSRLTGYLFAHDAGSPVPSVRLYPADGGARVTVPTADVEALVFSGDDKASGRSWQAWVARHEERQRARAQGRDVGDIEPQPEMLD